MKKHPIAERIDGFAPKLAKLPNAIRLELQSLHDDIKAYLQSIQNGRGKGGRAASGNSGRPPSEIPDEAQPYLVKIRSGEMSAYAASIELRKLYPKSPYRFSADTLRKWAAR